MATYINGITDYIPQIQPFRPDYNFLGNILQTRQTRYDAAKKQVSELYGSLLNSPLSRDGNIKRRDEFFKVIDNDIKKISGLDLSLQQNVDQAENVFKGFYEDKYMVSDMIKTKNHRNELEKGENSKNCYDQDKCGGVYNDLSIRKLQYKMEEYKALSDDEAYNFDMGSYDPLYIWQKDAIKEAKASGMSVTRDDVRGGYIVRDKNGKLLENGLYNLFDELYSNDPRVAANYDTKAYITRKEGVKALMPKYNNDEKEAQSAYITEAMNQGIKSLNKNLEITTNNFNQLNGRQIELENKKNAITDKEKAELEEIKQTKDRVSITQNNLQSKIDNIKNNMDEGNMAALINKADQSKSAYFQDYDLSKMAESLAMRNEEHTIVKADEIYMAKLSHSLSKDLKKYEHDLNVMRDVIGSNLKKGEELYKKQIGAGEKGEKDKKTTTTEKGEPEIVLNAAGNTADLHIAESPAGVYAMNSVKAMTNFTKANEESVPMLYKLLESAKKAAGNTTTGAGAIQYLDQTYGKGKWQNISTPEQLKFFVKTNPTLYLAKARNFIKDNPNTSWGKSVLQKNSADLIKIDLNLRAGGAETDLFKEGISKTISKVGNTSDPDYGLAKYLVNANGVLNYDDTPSAAFVKAYRINRPSGSDGDIQDSYEKVKKEVFRVYNRTAGTSFGQIVDLPGKEGAGGVTGHAFQYNAVDSADAVYHGVDVNKELSKTLNLALANPGKTKMVLGNLSAENFNKEQTPEEEEGVRAFFNQFYMDVKTADKEDNKRPIYSLQAQSIAGDDANQSGFTIVPSQEYIQEYYAKNEKTPGLVDPSILMTGASLFYDNRVIKTEFTKALEITNVEKVLVRNKSLVIDQYKETAGILDIDYDPTTGVTTLQPILNKYNKDGTVTPYKGSPSYISNIKNVNNKVNEYLEGFEYNQTNIYPKVEEIQRLNNSTKQK
jgi:hypothetical protein